MRRQDEKREPVLINSSSQGKWRWVIFASALVGVVGLLDYLTGPEIAFSLIYLIPVTLGAWFVGKPFGLAISVFSAAVWMIAEIAAGRFYSHIAIHYWNATTRLGFFVVVTLLLERLKTALSAERALSRVDYLTGVMNSRSFYELASMEIERCNRYGHPFTVAYIDIDNFKSINDQFGHPAGDDVLQAIANSIKMNLRKVDIVARLGGDEFVILLPETEDKAAATAIKKIQNVLKQYADLKKLSITFSIGILTCKTSPPSVDKMIELVDSLMYSVKNHGKNGVAHSIYKDNKQFSVRGS